MTRSFSSAALAAFLVLCSCRNHTDYAQTIINNPGRFECFDNQLIVTVSNTPNAFFTYSLSRKQVSVGPSNPPLRKGTAWTIYPESVDSVWVYDGAKDVTRIEFGPNGGAKFTSTQIVPSLLKSAPGTFLQRLPPDVRGA